MSVTNQTPVNAFTANGVTTVFNFTFQVLDSSDLRVQVDGEDKIIGSEYTVSGIGNPAGGSVTFVSAPASGSSVVAFRDSALERDTDYQNNGDLRAVTVNNDFDRLWLALQEILYGVQLAPTLRPGSPLSGTITLPDPGAGKFIRWNVTGDALEAAEAIFDNGMFLQSGAGAVSRTFDAKVAELSVTPQDFGAKGNGIDDDSSAIFAWLTNIGLTGRKGKLPSGRYKVTSALLLDCKNFSSVGLDIEGDGMQRSIIDLTSVSSGVPFQITDSNGATSGDTFYLSLSNFGVHTNINGVGAALGKNDLSDALNACVFDRLYFANASTGASACALEVNYVVQSYLNITTNCGGSAINGDALRLRQVQFSTVTGSGGNAANSMHLTGGYSFGNTILNWDAEEVKKCVLIDVATANSNTFIGGQLVWTVGGIDATAGSNNIFMNPNFGVVSNKVLNSTGIAVIGDGKGYGTLVGPNAIVRAPVGDSTHMIDAIAGQSASETYARANVRRWMLRMDNSPESGSDAGSNIILTRFSDAGANLGDVWYVTRSNGQMTINKLSAVQVGFFGTGPVSTKPTVSGARSGNAALTSLIGALSSLGLINDTTSA